MKKGSRSINTGGGAYIEGDVNVNGHGKFVAGDDFSHSGISADEVANLFGRIFNIIERHPRLSSTEKADVHQDVEEVREELSNKEQPNENFILRRLRNIGRVAPDILDVILATIVSPTAGFGMAAKKIAEKARASTE